MAATTGPCFAIQGMAPADWNKPGLLGDTQVAFSCAGRGWVLEVHSRSFKEKLLSESPTWIFVAHVLREDAEQYFAFASPAERALFLELREIDSVGPKTAAQLLGALETARIADLVHGRSLAGMKIPGVGPKTLEKISQGIKSNKEAFLRILGSLGSVDGGDDVPVAVVQALEKLGLRREEVARICRELSTETPGFEKAAPGEIIRRVLQLWGQRKTVGKVQVLTVEGNS